MTFGFFTLHQVKRENWCQHYLHPYLFLPQMFYLFILGKMKWEKPLTSGAPPPPLDSHTAILVGSRMFIFGGWDRKTALSQLYFLDTSKTNIFIALDIFYRTKICIFYGQAL